MAGTNGLFLRGFLCGNIVLLCVLSVYGQTVYDSERLLANLTSNYEKVFRPVIDQTKKLPVTIVFDLLSLGDFDEVKEKITTTGIMYLEWRDERFTWNPADFGGVQYLAVDLSYIWAPVILHVNPAEDVEGISENWHPLRVNSTSHVFYYLGNVFTSSCGVDVSYYPWDEQKCEIQFTVVSFDVVLVQGSNKVLTTFFSENGAWDLTGTATKIKYDESMAAFELQLARKSQFVVINVVAPIILLNLLNVLGFFIPTKIGGKSGFCLTVLLSIAVLLTVVGDNLPKTSNLMAWYSYYLLSVLIISVAITCTVIWSFHLYSKEEEEPVSEFWQSFVNMVNCRSTPKRQNAYRRKKSVHQPLINTTRPHHTTADHMNGIA